MKNEATMHGKTFQSTLSVRRATYTVKPLCAQLPISIHALREESDMAVAGGDLSMVISIHALREESDEYNIGIWPRMLYFNPRSP